MNKPKIFSPVLKKAPESEGVSFVEIIENILAGDKVARMVWPGDNVYCFLKDDLLQIHNDGNHSWVMSRVDLEADDWVVVK